ncbi:Uncharacterized protein APZ42_012671 [Daphnia magna]|uniref:Uncharacterized protein n=1 Tax=Daphnia magna TaxID=35525 RepID=A0A162RLK6_9CRUS|nr:Uncharacterized protein APZ42_012671 [Daphnia magna]
MCAIHLRWFSWRHQWLYYSLLVGGGVFAGACSWVHLAVLSQWSLGIPNELVFAGYCCWYDYFTPRECSWAGEFIAVSRVDLDSWSLPFT